MTNTNFANIDILEELESFLEAEKTQIAFDSAEINTNKIIESLDPSLETEKNQITFDSTEISANKILESLGYSYEDKIETINILNENLKNIDILENTNEKECVIVKKKNKFIGLIIFITKYILTSSLIFAALLITTNYSAYINIAKSYIYKGDLQVTSQKLISSVEASNIKEKYSEKELKKIEQSEESEKLSIKQMKKEQDKKNVSLNIEITPYENRIIIPKIGKNIPLLDIKNRNIDGEKELNSIFMKELENGVIRYPGSAKPGEDGTSFIFGHSSNFPWMKGDFNEVFSLLDKVSYNDEIIIYYNQQKYVYKIREKRVITPGDVSVLERNKKKSEITLMTCWPIGTTLNRLIVTGELIKVK